MRCLKMLLLVLFTVLTCGGAVATAADNMLIYCGITMIKPVQELAQIFEKKTWMSSQDYKRRIRRFAEGY